VHLPKDKERGNRMSAPSRPPLQTRGGGKKGGTYVALIVEGDGERIQSSVSMRGAGRGNAIRFELTQYVREGGENLKGRRARSKGLTSTARKKSRGGEAGWIVGKYLTSLVAEEGENHRGRRTAKRSRGKKGEQYVLASWVLRDW